MSDPVPDAVRRYMDTVAPDATPIQAEMETVADEESFPIIGRAVGGLLWLLARATNAERVFEFGSGFGYSATWFLRGMGPEGRIVLTEHDPDELEMGRDFFAEAGLADRAAFEAGDAMETITHYDGPFDLVLIDHQKSRYAEAVDRLDGKLAPGGTLIADNMLRGPLDFEDALAGLEGGDVEGIEDDQARGVARFLDRVGSDPDFTAALLPIGSGVTLATYTGAGP